MSAPEPSQTRAVVAPGQRADAAMREIFLTCATDFDRHLRLLMRSDDPEGPHGARVALRRLRTALRAFRPILRRKVARPLRQEARALFRALGPLRDADVLAGEIATGDGAEALAVRAARLRGEARAALEAAGADGFADRVAAQCAGKGWRRRGVRRLAAGPVEDLAAQALSDARARVGSHGKHVAKMTTEDRHGFRKDLKGLRYLTDFFAPLWPGKRQRRFLAGLKRLQDALGTLNDLAVAEAQLVESGADVRARLAEEALATADAEWTRLRKRRPWWRR